MRLVALRTVAHGVTPAVHTEDVVYEADRPYEVAPCAPCAPCDPSDARDQSDGLPSDSDRVERWASTMRGLRTASGVVVAHEMEPVAVSRMAALERAEREAHEESLLAAGATLSKGAGRRALDEPADPYRTCFERDRDRILHSTAFRRLAGKTQVFVFPADHQRTRLTHALEVAQVATAVARATRLNVALTEAIALGHDCGHGPGGHASETAFGQFLDGGYDHAVWGADVVFAAMNLCEETLDGIRNHSWSRPAPATPEGVVVSWADRIAYCAHDLEDALCAGIVEVGQLPQGITDVIGATRSSQLRTLIGALVGCITRRGVVAMDEEAADALAALRAFNYENIYTRPEAIAQASAVISVLRALVEHFSEHPDLAPESARRPWGLDSAADPVRAAVAYVAGMTDRYAFEMALDHLGWDSARLPTGIDMPALRPARARRLSSVLVGGPEAPAPLPGHAPSAGRYQRMVSSLR